MYLGAASGTTVSHVSDIVGPVSTKLSQRLKLQLNTVQSNSSTMWPISTEYSQELLQYQLIFFHLKTNVKAVSNHVCSPLENGDFGDFIILTYFLVFYIIIPCLYGQMKI